MSLTKKIKKSNFWKNNALSIAFLVIFIITLFAQSLTGYAVFNDQRKNDFKMQPVSYSHYLSTGHFVEATFENWESEFLQMALFIVIAIRLRQKGSAQSKPVDEKDEVDQPPDPNKPGAPWPVRKGGFWLWIYKHSLSIVFFSLFLICITLHFFGSFHDYNYTQAAKGEQIETALSYLTGPQFWFESFQNWQSEFLSIFCIIVFTIFLREQGSPQSKPVNKPDDQNE